MNRPAYETDATRKQHTVSNLPELIAPVASPAASERQAPRPADDARRSAADDGPRFADELDKERAAERADERDRAAERKADQNRATEQTADRDPAAEQAENRNRPANQGDHGGEVEKAADQERIVDSTAQQDQTIDKDYIAYSEQAEATALTKALGSEIVDETTPDLIRTGASGEPVAIEPAQEPLPDVADETPADETPLTVPQQAPVATKQPVPDENTPVSVVENIVQTPSGPETASVPISDAPDQVTADEKSVPDNPKTDINHLVDEAITVPDAAPASREVMAETPDVIKVTALSGETVPLTPPPAPINAPAEPGALGRWFAQAAGPISPDGPMLPSSGLLNKLSAETSQQALNSGQPVSRAGGLETVGQIASQPTAAPEMTFADAMAASSMDGESLDALVTQAINKANATLEPGKQTALAVTTGQTVATGAQAAMTAVPQAATGQAVPVTALAVEITRQAANGKTQFDIRLDPPELGRLNVRLEMDASGQTRTHLVVERAETLDMLSSDARSLERALQQAGLKSEPGSVSFELAQDATDSFDQGDQSAATKDDGDGQSAEAADSASDGEPSDDPLTAITSPEAIRHQIAVTGHLDVHV